MASSTHWPKLFRETTGATQACLVHALRCPYCLLAASGRCLPRMKYPRNPHVAFTRVNKGLGCFKGHHTRMFLEKHPVLTRGRPERSDGGRSREGMLTAPEMIRFEANQPKQRLTGAKAWQLVSQDIG